LVFILKGRDRRKLITWGITGLFIFTVLLILISIIPDSGVAGLAGATRYRLSTAFKIDTYLGKDGSFAFRQIENQYALRQILAHPLQGLGMSARYRPFDWRLDTGGADLRWLIHNGHFRILLDSGVLGYLAFWGLSLTFLVRGLRYWHIAPDKQLGGIVLGFTLVYLAVLIAAIANGTFTNWSWTPVLGIIMGVNEVVFRMSTQEDT